MKLCSLQDLGPLREALASRQRRQQAEAYAAARARALAEAHSAVRAKSQVAARRGGAPAASGETPHSVFSAHVGPVHPLRPQRGAELRRARPAPLPRQREADERAALLEALSDEVDVETLLLTDDGLSFRRPGIGPDVLTQLRRGRWVVQTQLDLHGLRREEARDALAGFVRDTVRRGQRCVRVVHGKGHGSPGRQPVLKSRVQRWLAQCVEVIAFAQASGPQGGAGALIVLLADQRPRTMAPARR